jgi:hypothetical protein
VTRVIDHALQSITGVIAYGVRVSAYGYSHQWLRRPRKRLRSGRGHTGRSARSAGRLVGLVADVQPPLDVAHLERPITQNTFSLSQEPDVTRIFPSDWRSTTMVALSLVASFSRTFSVGSGASEPANERISKSTIAMSDFRPQRRECPLRVLAVSKHLLQAVVTGRRGDLSYFPDFDYALIATISG